MILSAIGVILVLAPVLSQESGETLPNGITLPRPWPPAKTSLPNEPVRPAYLDAPPAVIPIDLGRQLLVDDFLVEKTTLKRVFHLARYHEASPVLKPDRPWEKDMAMAFSDGVFYDPKDKLFKMWYLAGPPLATCYATSTDGLHWRKPSLDVEPGTNIVQRAARDSSTVWLDLEETHPDRRYKMFRSCSGGSTVKGAFGLATFFSADGIHWKEPALLTGSCGDRSTVFWNPFRRVWVYSLRHGWGEPRERRYWERADLAEGPLWSAITEPGLWVGADREDPMRPDLKIPPQLYNLDAVAYESLLLGLFTIWRGQPKDRQKPNDLVLGYSRDGFSWDRPDRRAFCPVSDRQGDWNANNVQSAGGGCLIVGEELWFYVSGRAGVPGSSKQGVSTTGLAVLRRDGFASLEAGEEEGTLLTRPVLFSGSHLFVNLEASEGELWVEALDGKGRAVARSVRGPGRGTAVPVAWAEGGLGPQAGKPVRFCFHLKKGRLYAFWVSRTAQGASGGYVAAGGPAYGGIRDLEEER